MRVRHQLVILLVTMVSTDALAQLTIPNVVQLPSDDFVWPWGRPIRGDDGERPQFDIQGTEANFNCTLTGSFRLGSRMRDFYNLRGFEQQLSTSLYFIQDATAVLNHYYRQNDLQWATLDCFIPDFEATEEETEEKLDRAIQRAERARERRRRQAEDSDD